MSGSYPGKGTLPLQQLSLTKRGGGEPGRPFHTSDEEDTPGDARGQLPHGHRDRGLHGSCNGTGAPLRFLSSPARAAVQVERGKQVGEMEGREQRRM